MGRHTRRSPALATLVAGVGFLVFSGEMFFIVFHDGEWALIPAVVTMVLGLLFVFSWIVEPR